MKNNSVPFKIIKTDNVGIREETSFETEWYMNVNLFIISDGFKFGVAYNKNECIKKEEEYIILIDCQWEYIEITDTEYGAFVVAYSNGKCCCYSLLGKDEEFIIEIETTLICNKEYSNIKYDRREDDRLLLLGNGNAKSYNIITQTVTESDLLL